MPEMVSLNPATEEVMAKFECLSGGKAASEVLKSREAFKSWGSLGVGERCVYLKKAAAVLRKNAKRYGELISKEMGKPITQSVPEVEKCAWACEYYAENAGRFLADQPVATEAKKSYVMFQPLGTILGIMPWNFPFWQVFRFAAATLAAGNTVVVKHSSNVPQCGIAIEEVFREAGFPDNVYRNLIMSSESVEPLVGNGLVEGISLTGSTEAGRKIGGLGGRWIKKVVLELGGSDPFIVLDDADVQKAASVGVTARFQNAGQSCIAAKRFIVHKAIEEEFKRDFVERMESLVVGDPMDAETDVGPLARSDLRDALSGQLKAAVKEGAKVLGGGKEMRRKGFFFEPTAIEAPKGALGQTHSRLEKGARFALREEIFGPIATIIAGKSDDELLEIANDSIYGLSSSVWSESRGRAEGIARKLQAGMVTINGMSRSDPRLPFGGVKDSGLGRELGGFGILEFVNIKSVISL